MKIIKTSANVTQGMNPQVRKAILESLKGNKLSLTQVSPFLQTLFQNLGDIPISMVKQTIESLAQEESAKNNPQANQQAVAPQANAPQANQQAVTPQANAPQANQQAVTPRANVPQANVPQAGTQLPNMGR